MKNEIVVGVDGSSTSFSALRWAQALADTDAAVRAVYAWSTPLASAAMSASEHTLEADARHKLDAILARVPAGSVKRSSVIVRDVSAAGALIDESKDAALLVTGTRGLTRLERIMLGSVAVECAQHSRCPFIAVPKLAALQRSCITVGFDDSAAAHAALRWAIGWGSRRSMKVEVVQVRELTRWRLAADPAPPDEGDRDALAARVRAVVGNAVDELDLLVVDGTSVVDELLRASKDSSLLAVGSRGLGGFAGLLLGSVSRRCLELSPLPVAVIRDY